MLKDWLEGESKDNWEDVSLHWIGDGQEGRGRIGERERGAWNKNRNNLILVQQMVANGHRLIRRGIK